MRAQAQTRAVLALIGFTAVIAQIVLMRELIVAFNGNELSMGLMLASWLLWTALGSGFIGRYQAGLSPREAVAVLLAVTAVTFPLAIIAIRESRALLQHAAGELLGFGPLALTALLTLGLFCPFSGWLFAAGSRWLADESSASPASATSAVYVLEAAGAAIGGALASLVLVRHLSPLMIAAFAGAVNLLAAAVLLGRRQWRTGAMAAIIACSLALVARPAETFTLGRFWRGFRVLAVLQSVYGNLALLESEGSRSLAENGLILTTVPDPAAAEEAVHFALLEHLRPQSVLVIGGCANGSLDEARKHPSVARLDCVELDPAIPELAKRFLPGAIPRDPRVHMHAIDGVRFVKTTAQLFDVIIVNLPEPQTAQLNRYYTAEFFAASARRLHPGGVLALAFPASENYLSPETRTLLRCMRKTLSEVFPHVAALPGETVHLFGSTAPLTTSAPELVQRLHSRNIKTLYVSEHFLPFRLAPERIRELDWQIQPDSATPANTDFAPIAYYFDLTLWGAKFGASYGQLMERAGHVPFRGLAAALLLAAAVLAFATRSAPAAFCAGATGFTMIGVEIILLLGFQAAFGYVYQQLALLVAALMAGMSLGSWIALRATVPSTLAYLQLVVAASPLVAFGLLARTAAAPAIALACGALGGFQFATASRHYFALARPNPGILYALDLAGSCAGALMLSAYLIPVFGFLRTSWLLALANLAPAVGALCARRRPGR